MFNGLLYSLFESCFCFEKERQNKYYVVRPTSPTGGGAADIIQSSQPRAELERHARRGVDRPVGVVSGENARENHISKIPTMGYT